MFDPRSILNETISEAARGWFDAAIASPDLPVMLPGLPRRVGREPCGGTRSNVEERDVDFGAWRTCDLAALLLFEAAAPDEATVLDLFAHGDFEERAMVLRTRSALPIDGATLALLGEVQRTNTQDHMDAMVLDSDLVSRAVDGGFSLDDFNRLMLKVAFVQLPVARMFDVARHANAELTTMLQDLATEREAAGRNVWPDTNRLIGHAPAAGTIARLLGGLEHGDDNQRHAAVDGIAVAGRDDLIPYLRERLPREPHPLIRDAIEAAIPAES